MLPVGGQPVIHHVLDLLARSGVEEVFMNLHHRAEVLSEYCQDGARWRLRITYAFEPELLGTAGAVKNFEKHLGSGPFFVVYGDNYLDCDLLALCEFHNARRALATIAVFEKDDVSASGVVDLDANGRVRRLVEKPLPSEVFSRLINGGLYVLSPAILSFIPADRPSDFARDVFPTLVAAGHAIYGRVMEGTVWGIDTPALYEQLRAQIGDARA